MEHDNLRPLDNPTLEWILFTKFWSSSLIFLFTSSVRGWMSIYLDAWGSDRLHCRSVIFLLKQWQWSSRVPWTRNPWSTSCCRAWKTQRNQFNIINLSLNKYNKIYHTDCSLDSLLTCSKQHSCIFLTKNNCSIFLKYLVQFLERLQPFAFSLLSATWIFTEDISVHCAGQTTWKVQSMRNHFQINKIFFPS